MSSPPSLRNERFFSLPSTPNQKVLGDDYAHKKNCVFKLKGNTKRGVFNYKRETTNVGENKDVKTSDEIKFQFPMWDFYCQARIKRSGEIKNHFDLGNMKIGKDFNFYMQFKTNMALQNVWGRVGVNYFGKKCESANRLERDGKGQHFLSHRTVVRDGSFQYGLCGILNLDNLHLTKYDAMFNYNHNDIDLTLKHNSGKYNGNGALAVGRVLGALTWKATPKDTVSVQCKKNFEQGAEKVRFVLGGQRQHCDRLLLKAKADQKLKLTFSGKLKMENGVTATGSVQLNCQHGKDMLQMNRIFPVPLGFQFDYNM